MTTNHPTAGHTTAMVGGTACGLDWATTVANPALSIIGLLPTPQLRTAAFLAVLRTEVHRRSGREHPMTVPDHLPRQARKKGIDDAGVLSRFSGVAVHDAWAPYDHLPRRRPQLCCAHALRELQCVAEAAPPQSQWCWADQAADALVAMQTLVAESIAAGADAVAPDALATQVHLYRSAAQLAITQTRRPVRRGDEEAQRAGPQAD